MLLDLRSLIESSTVIVLADFSASGLGVATGNGVAIWDSAYSSDGLAAISGAGVAIWNTLYASTGIAVVSATAATVIPGVSSSVAVGTVTGIGVAIWDVLYSSDGLGAATSVSGSTDGSVYSSDGIGTASADGENAATSTIVSADGSSAGVASSSFVSASVIPGVTASNGVGTALATGVSVFATVYSSNGLAAATAISGETIGVIYASTGVASGAAVGENANANAAASIIVRYDGKRVDRVSSNNTGVGLGGDGFYDGVIIMTYHSSTPRTITGIVLTQPGVGTWDTDQISASWVIGVSRTLEGAFLNDLTTGEVNIPVVDNDTFRLFISITFNNVDFVTGNPLTLTVTFSDTSTAVAIVLIVTPYGNGRVPIRYVVGTTPNIVPVETVTVGGINVVPCEVMIGPANVVPVREAPTEIPRVKIQVT